MKCFRHHDADAVAVCCRCGRGVCVRCAVVHETDGLTCSENCRFAQRRRLLAEDVILENALSSARGAKGVALFLQLAAVMMAIFAIGQLVTDFLLAPGMQWTPRRPPLISLGLASIPALGAIFFLVAWRAIRPITKKLERLSVTLQELNTPDNENWPD